MSAYIWQLKREGKKFEINWKILKHAKPFTPANGQCALCTAEKDIIIFREELNVGTVPTFKMHNIGTVPTFKMHNVGTVPTYKMYNIGTVPTFKMHNIGTQVFFLLFCLNLDCMEKINDCSLHPFFYLSRLSLFSRFLSPLFIQMGTECSDQKFLLQ